MFEIVISYIVPLFICVAIVGVLAMKISAGGGPAPLFIVFFLILFAPSLFYAAIADDSSSVIFLISLIAALAVTGFLWVKFYKK